MYWLCISLFSTVEVVCFLPVPHSFQYTNKSYLVMRLYIIGFAILN